MGVGRPGAPVISPKLYSWKEEEKVIYQMIIPYILCPTETHNSRTIRKNILKLIKPKFLNTVFGSLQKKKILMEIHHNTLH
jgi:hypothetical protein